MLKKLLYLVPIIIMCILIFVFSAENGNVSGGKSRQLIKAVSISACVVSERMGIIEEMPTHEQINQFVLNIEYPVRKLAHISIFFTLALIIMFTLRSKTKLKFWKVCLICLAFCFVVGLVDEFHQTFVDGRSGEFLDVIIDSGGALLAILAYDFFRYLNKALNS